MAKVNLRSKVLVLRSLGSRTEQRWIHIGIQDGTKMAFLPAVTCPLSHDVVHLGRYRAICVYWDQHSVRRGISIADRMPEKAQESTVPRVAINIYNSEVETHFPVLVENTTLLQSMSNPKKILETIL